MVCQGHKKLECQGRNSAARAHFCQGLFVLCLFCFFLMRWLLCRKLWLTEGAGPIVLLWSEVLGSFLFNATLVRKLKNGQPQSTPTWQGLSCWIRLPDLRFRKSKKKKKNWTFKSVVCWRYMCVFGNRWFQIDSWNHFWIKENSDRVSVPFSSFPAPFFLPFLWHEINSLVDIVKQGEWKQMKGHLFEIASDLIFRRERTPHFFFFFLFFERDFWKQKLVFKARWGVHHDRRLCLYLWTVFFLSLSSFLFFFFLSSPFFSFFLYLQKLTWGGRLCFLALTCSVKKRGVLFLALVSSSFTFFFSTFFWLLFLKKKKSLGLFLSRIFRMCVMEHSPGKNFRTSGSCFEKVFFFFFSFFLGVFFFYVFNLSSLKLRCGYFG